MDFTDQHIYGEGELDDADFATSPLKKASSLQKASFARLQNKPFIVSEWNKDYPKVYRGEYPLTFAAIAAFQGWNGAILYSYAHDSWSNKYLHHPNDVVVDPARFYLLPAASLIFRRGIKAASASATVKITENEVYESNLAPEDMFAYRTGLWQKRLALSWQASDVGIDPREVMIKKNASQVNSPEGQLFWDWGKGYRLINTPIAQAFVGRGGGKLVATDDVKFKIGNEFAALALVSHEKEPQSISKSKKLLLFITAKAKNSGEVLYSKGTRQIYEGKAPILSERMSGDITIRNEGKDLRFKTVFPASKKSREGSLVKKENGWWGFSILPTDEANIYEIYDGKSSNVKGGRI
jgi:hypothetical protein